MQRKFILVVSLLLTLTLIGHFGMTFLYLSPSNPFRAHHWSKIQAYMSPYFTQNWYLFAPNPVNQHQNLHIRIRYKDENGQTKTTKWKDITKPMIEKLHANRLSPNQRVYSFQSSAAHSYVWKDGDVRKRAEKSLRLYVDYYLKTHPKPEGTIEQIQMRIAVNKFPRFDQRMQPDSKGEVNYTYSNWFPYK